MKKPSIKAIKSGIQSGLATAKEHAEPVAKEAVSKGRAFLKTKTGKRIATGGLAGGAIGLALPILTIATGAILGAGALVLYKSMQDKETD